MSERALRVDDRAVGAPAIGVCTVCGARFISRHQDVGEALKQLRTDFDRHNCKEDASQAAARVVIEATEDK
jgi:hypothetical protein